MEKKRWEKYKRDMKKLGFTNFGYYFNIQQQKKHTATISLAEISDPENLIAEAKEKLSNKKWVDTEAKERAVYHYSYIKRNRHLYDELFIPSAKRDIKEGKYKAEEYLQHCLDESKHYDDGTYLEWKTQKEKEEIIKALNTSIENQKKVKVRSEQEKDARGHFDKILQVQPTKDLLSEINGQLIFDCKNGVGPAYARFLW